MYIYVYVYNAKHGAQLSRRDLERPPPQVSEYLVYTQDAKQYICILFICILYM